MSRSLPLAALALAVAASGCTKAKSSGPSARLRQPNSIALFQGLTLGDAAAIRPYLAVANSARNDVALIDAVGDSPVNAPIALRALQLPVEHRPTLLAAASLGDDDLAATPPVLHADLLVAVSGGDSVLQVIETWDEKNTVRSDPSEASALAVDLGQDVLALVPLPSAPRTARIAALLAGDAGAPTSRVAIVAFKRDPVGGEAIVRDGDPIVGAALGIHAEALAAMPDDPDLAGIQTALYVATLDPIAADGGGNPLYGAVELAADLSVGKALVARAPTRLVAAARVRERLDGSAANGPAAFQASAVPRVYAVLDESGCGKDKPIDCGVVTLDPTVPSGAQAIPPDYAGLQPYRAPMFVPGRPLQLAISAPPEKPLGDLTSAGEVDYPAGFMRLYMGSIARATTAVAVVPSDDSFVYFLDLGRFETATQTAAVSGRSTGSSQTLAQNLWVTPPDAEVTNENDKTHDVRLWLQRPYDPSDTTGLRNGQFVDFAVTTPDPTQQLFAAVQTTPGFTPDGTFTAVWQGPLSGQLLNRIGEAATEGAQLVLALQIADRTDAANPIFAQVVRLWHPALGVQRGDIAVIKAAQVPGCTGTLPVKYPGQTVADTALEFEVVLGDLVPPSDSHPGGAVALAGPRTTGDTTKDAAWSACFAALNTAASGTFKPSLQVALRAQGLVLSNSDLGYLGRPQLGDPAAATPIVHPHVLQYPAPPPSTETEADLVAACPVAAWDGSFPVAGPMAACDDACRTACEKLVIGRKSRRIQNLSVDCATNPTNQTACETWWPPAQYPFPQVNGPVLAFQVALQARDPVVTPNPQPVRGMSISLTTSGSLQWTFARESSVSPYQATGALPFDRSRWTTATDGYRFYVSYPADFVYDLAPSQAGTRVPAAIIK